MLFIKKKRPCLNTQSDSICAKLFTYICHLLHAYFCVLSPCTVYIKLSNFLFFSLDMESSKRCVKLLSLIFSVCFGIHKGNGQTAQILNYLMEQRKVKVTVRSPLYSWAEKGTVRFTVLSKNKTEQPWPRLFESRLALTHD